MKLIDWNEFIHGELKSSGPLSATIGVFDGIHIGHRELLREIQSYSMPAVVFTFRVNPKKKLNPGDYHGDISTLRLKLGILDRLGISTTVLIDFSEEFSRLNGKDFSAFLCNNADIRQLTIGKDFRCGYRNETDSEAFKVLTAEYGTKTSVFSFVMNESLPVSSSQIRSAVLAGHLDLAQKLLGYPFSLDVSGYSEKGSISISATEQILPPKGSYDIGIVGQGETSRGTAIISDYSVEWAGENGRIAESLYFDTIRAR